jgi:ribonuclease D
MSAAIIDDRSKFLKLCDQLASADQVAFDTEFVSDFGYRPRLALLQFCTTDLCVAVDPLSVGDLAPWWNIMADPDIPVIVHGGQAEIRFCVQLGGLKPVNLIDVQIAEGFRCRSYPLSYSAIVLRVLDCEIHSSQTRTDWSRRPLSPEQIEYALDDVTHLAEIWERQRTWLDQRNRTAWARAEFDRQIAVIASEEENPVWEKVSGIHKLARRDLEAAKRLAEWREQEAERANRQPRRILRDDLLIDLARRRPKSVKQALHTRDLNRPEYRKRLDQVIKLLAEVNTIPDGELAPRLRSRRDDVSSDEQVIAKLLALALANRCAELDVAQTLVGTNRDLNELVRCIRGKQKNADPILLTGWRSDMCGELLKQVLSGRVGFRVSPPGASTPLLFDETEQ